MRSKVIHQIAEVLNSKLQSALQQHEEALQLNINKLFAKIGPFRDCPLKSQTISEIAELVRPALAERHRIAEAIVESTVSPFKSQLNGRSIQRIMDVIERHFPLDKYSNLDQWVNRIYESKQAPNRPRGEDSFSHAAGLLRVNSENAARQSRDKLRLLLQELHLQDVASKPTSWQGFRRLIGSGLAWLFSQSGLLVLVALVALAFTVFGWKMPGWLIELKQALGGTGS